MRKTITILNGPNLNLLGTRQPEIYGSKTLKDVEQECRDLGADLGVDIKFDQTNDEGKLVDLIQAARNDSAGIIINPAAYSHTSIAILDALNMFDGPVIEVHISNIHTREKFRHFSYVTQRAQGVIMGCGTNGYTLALRQITDLIA